MRRARNAPGVVGELRLTCWLPGLAKSTTRSCRSWLAANAANEGSGPRTTERLATAGAAAVAGVPEFWLMARPPPWTRKTAPGAWVVGLTKTRLPAPVLLSSAPAELARGAWMKRVREAETSMVPPPLLMGWKKLPYAANLPPARIRLV